VVLNGSHNPSPLLLPDSVTRTCFEEDLPLRTMHVCNYLISGTFHSPSGVLFSFPSRY
jgi:hypothetical protein